MDISRLKVAVPSYQITEEGGPVAYLVTVEYGKLSWDVWRRYSQFAQLYRDLTRDGHCALPPLPPKTVAGPPQDPRTLADRRHRLQYFLLELLRRPDTRTSPVVLDFLLFAEQASLNIPHLRPSCLCSTGVQRFAVSSIAFSPVNRVVFVSHEDKTGLFRLGRLWSLVEPDEFGMINVWATDANVNSLSLMQSLKTQAKVRCLLLDEATNQLFAGHDDGKVAVYLFDTEELKIEKVKELDLHTAAVMHLVSGKSKQKRLLSLGFDGAIRVVEIGNHQVLSGGRLTKRLGSGVHLTVGHFDDESDTAYLGTSGGQVLVYGVKNNPPTFVQGLTVHPVYPVEALCMDKMYLFVGHGEYVSVISIEQRRAEQKFSKVAILTLRDSPSPVLSMAYDSLEKRLFVGYDPAIAWWSIDSGQPLCVWEAHGGGVHHLAFTDRADIIISGGDSGNTKVWRLPPAKDLQLWQPASTDDDSPKEPRLDHLGPTGERAGFVEDEEESDAAPVLHAAHPGILRSQSSERSFDIHGLGPKSGESLFSSGNQAKGTSKATSVNGFWECSGAIPDDGQKQGNAEKTSGEPTSRPRAPSLTKEKLPTPFGPKSEDDDEELDDIRSAFT
ncbi:wd g-beta repeat-containing protein [Cystoisospora suis]|uniref:Wd g-beta repeat-containing protein n=1 Tax=Cystoisospora suis TaxID=483139 RepID=A0A2C6KLW9_9APIC|nr:wd g-beta repeat-containing protein [Cystoisospora suis]